MLLAATSLPRTKRPASSGECRVPRRTPEFVLQFYRSARSARSLYVCFPEIGRDAFRVRVPTEAAEGTLRPGAVGGQAIPGGKPSDPACAAFGSRRHRRPCDEDALRRGAFDRRRRRGDDHERNLLLPRQGAVRSFPRDDHAVDARSAERTAAPSASGVRQARPGRSRIRWR